MMLPIPQLNEGKYIGTRGRPPCILSSYYDIRFLLLNRLQEYPQIKVLLLESLCTDKKVIIGRRINDPNAHRNVK